MEAAILVSKFYILPLVELIKLASRQIQKARGENSNLRGKNVPFLMQKTTLNTQGKPPTQPLLGGEWLKVVCGCPPNSQRFC